ncbi:hypothetical protein ACLB2K_015286 [Fragaria x ananassa]
MRTLGIEHDKLHAEHLPSSYTDDGSFRCSHITLSMFYSAFDRFSLPPFSSLHVANRRQFLTTLSSNIYHKHTTQKLVKENLPVDARRRKMKRKRKRMGETR